MYLKLISYYYIIACARAHTHTQTHKHTCAHTEVAL